VRHAGARQVGVCVGTGTCPAQDDFLCHSVLPRAPFPLPGGVQVADAAAHLDRHLLRHQGEPERGPRGAVTRARSGGDDGPCASPSRTGRRAFCARDHVDGGGFS